MFVAVSSDNMTDVAVPPCKAYLKVGRHQGPYYKFYIPGILFTLILGREGATACDSIALNSSRGKFMLLSPWKKDSLFHRIKAAAKQFRPKG